MEDVKELKHLEKITKVDERTMYKSIMNHYKWFGVNIGVTDGFRSYIQEDYFSQICDEYEMIHAKVQDYHWLLENRSNSIPIDRKQYVYFLFEGYKIIYIGQSVNVSGRISTHNRSKIFDSATVVLITDGTRLLTEALNIMYYKPKYNIHSGCYEVIFESVLTKLFY